ncbi:MAG: hypothetical protein H7X86_06490, partial [Gorillibacterium sp.]|nr:hypothetical protein [Gorillibacterium sp.]
SVDSNDKGFLNLSGEGSFAGSGAFAEPAKSSSDNKVSFSPPGFIVENADSLIFTANNEQLLSANEKNEAIIENQRVLIRTKLGELIFLSPTQWAWDDTIHLCSWLNDFQLLYKVDKADGTVPQYIIDIGLKLETKK